MKKLIRFLPFVVLALLISAPGPQPGGHGLGGNPRAGDPRLNAPNPPLFSFSSPNAYYDRTTKTYYPPYRGLPSADGCYAAGSITGTKGEALTFTRATTRFCPTDGTANESTGVMCASGEACITTLSGNRGLSIFRDGTNLVLRSEEFENAAWSVFHAGTSSDPVVTANYAAAPDGTMTAERVQFSVVTSAPDESSLYQNVGGVCIAAACSISVWIKGNGTSGNIPLAAASSGSDGNDYVLCSYNATAWKRCSLKKQASGTYAAVWLGYVASQSGAGPAMDVLVWGAQMELNPYATPYIKTTSAAATRNAEVASFPLPSASQETFSMAWTTLSALPNGLTSGRVGTMTRFASGAGDYIVLYVDTQLRADAVGSAAASAASGGTLVSGDRAAMSYSGDVLRTYKNGAQTSTDTTVNALGAANVLFVGSNTGGGFQLDALISDVCVDSDSTRCR